mmetsp:Transcript_113112/g.217836  ORF Transcript_113112/g.217836 Transcript_113112/m.217836 type:complete len:174 (+) Transcript_113112:174-695(+)
MGCLQCGFVARFEERACFCYHRDCHWFRRDASLCFSVAWHSARKAACLSRGEGGGLRWHVEAMLQSLLSVALLWSFLEEFGPVNHIQPEVHWLHQMDRTHAACDPSHFDFVPAGIGYQPSLAFGYCSKVKGFGATFFSEGQISKASLSVFFFYAEALNSLLSHSLAQAFFSMS